MSGISISNCSECLDLLIVDWGHSIEKKIKAIQANITSVKIHINQQSIDTEEVNQLLSNIEEHVNGLIKFPSPFLLEKVKVNELVDNVVNKIREFYSGISDLEVEGKSSPDEPVVIANYIWLRRLLYILLDNSVDAMKDSTMKRIIINTVVDSERVKITVSDTGKGIEPEIYDSLFTDLPNIDPNGKGRGTYIAKLISDIYHGEIVKEDSNGIGTALSVILPIGE